MRWLIGIDGGGTKTIGCAADSSGRILARTESGPSNYHTVGIAGFQSVVSHIIEKLAAECGLKKQDLAVVSLGLAGVDRAADEELVLQALRQLALPCEFLVHNDAKAALAAGLGAAEGIVLIAGTGSIAYGINKSGEVVRAGGWGHVASDEGSGYSIGRQALARCIKAAEGRDTKTVLTDRIMRYWGLSDWDQFVGRINDLSTDKQHIASLAQVVAEAAGEGDQVAAEILRQAAVELAGLVNSVIERGFDSGTPVPVCLYGSVLGNVPMLRHNLAAALGQKAELVLSPREPAVGAVLLGLERLKKEKLNGL